MRRISVFLAGSAAALITMTAAAEGFAAQWPEVLEEIRARQAKFISDVKDLSMVQEMIMVTPDGEMTAEMKFFQKGKKFRSESVMNIPDMPESMGPMKTTVIFDGKDTWMISPMTGKKKLSPKESREQQKDKNWWDFVSEKAKITGKEKAGGRDCYVVDLSAQKDAPFTTLWLDEKNLVPMRMQSVGPKKEVMITEFSDFKTIKGGWEMPYKTVMSLNGNPVSTIVVKSLEVNKGIADEQFDAAKVTAERPGFSMGDMMREMMK